jgi:hypothetical protein
MATSEVISLVLVCRINACLHDRGLLHAYMKKKKYFQDKIMQDKYTILHDAELSHDCLVQDSCMTAWCKILA